MSDETLAALLVMLKTDLGIMATAYDERLKQYLKASVAFITEEGAVLDYTSIQDQSLVVMYAAWLWRRRDSGQRMPRMLRYALNNRVFSRKMKDG